MVVANTEVVPVPAKWGEMRQGDGRNRALWERCMRAGAGYGPEQMIELGRHANQSFKEPLMDAEVVKIATSAWQHDAAGLNFFTRPRIMIDHDIFDSLGAINQDAVFLLLKLIATTVATTGSSWPSRWPRVWDGRCPAGEPPAIN